jgi:hypothetical protein
MLSVMVTIPLDLLKAYSRCEISRRDISRVLDEDIGFGDVLAGLHAHGLKLPRYPAHPGSAGVELVRRLAERAMPKGK